MRACATRRLAAAGQTGEEQHQPLPLRSRAVGVDDRRDVVGVARRRCLRGRAPGRVRRTPRPPGRRARGRRPGRRAWRAGRRPRRRPGRPAAAARWPGPAPTGDSHGVPVRSAPGAPPGCRARPARSIWPRSARPPPGRTCAPACALADLGGREVQTAERAVLRMGQRLDGRRPGESRASGRPSGSTSSTACRPASSVGQRERDRRAGLVEPRRVAASAPLVSSSRSSSSRGGRAVLRASARDHPASVATLAACLPTPTRHPAPCRPCGPFADEPRRPSPRSSAPASSRATTTARWSRSAADGDGVVVGRRRRRPDAAALVQQAAPGAGDGPARLDLPPDLLALACASHSGEPFHLDGVRRILARRRPRRGRLQTPPDYPLDDAPGAADPGRRGPGHRS